MSKKDLLLLAKNLIFMNSYAEGNLDKYMFRVKRVQKSIDRSYRDSRKGKPHQTLREFNINKDHMKNTSEMQHSQHIFKYKKYADNIHLESHHTEFTRDSKFRQ